MQADAFRPMYDEAVVLKNAPASGAIFAATLPACVFETGFDAPVDDASVATERLAFNVLIPKSEWVGHTPPRIGMIAEVRGLLTTVEAVAPVMGDWQLTVREKKPSAS